MILPEFDDLVTQLPDGIAFCDKCIKFRIQILKDEINYYTDYRTKIQLMEAKKTSLTVNEQVPDSPMISPTFFEADPVEIDAKNLKEQQSQINKNIFDLIDQANLLKKSHHLQIENINNKEKELIYLQEKIKEARTKSEYYQRKIDHMKNFSIFNEVFEIEITSKNGKINGMELGISEESKEINWTFMNTSFGNILHVFLYIIKVS